MTATLSERELLEWMAAYSLDPWGPERADLNSGIIAAMIANVNRDPRKGKPISPADLMPKYGPQAEDEMPTPERMKEQLLATFGPRIKRKPKPDQ